MQLLSGCRLPVAIRHSSSLIERWTLNVGRWTFPPSMLPLATGTFPSSAPELTRLLNESLGQIFLVDSDPVNIRANSFPHLETLSISLDHARLRPDPPRPPVISGQTSPALEVDQLTLNATPLSLGPAAIDLSLSARGVHLGQAQNLNDEIILTLEKAAEGNIEISIAQTDLEALIARLAQDQAGKQGITIDSVRLMLRQKNPHSLDVEVSLRAKKLFLSASIKVTGQLDLDDQLNLKISGLSCTGDGGIATLACGLLKPYLQKIDGREFPLMSLPLGRVHLRDVQLTVADKLRVTAEFGSAV
jgi:hypothetical protein